MKTIRITYLGIGYEVAEGLPIVRALESAGVPIRHGSGCRQGFCGACALVYRLPGSAQLHGALACQTLVRDGMDICRLPRVPARRQDLDVREVAYAEDLLELYPELADCTACGACDAICPLEIDVLGAVKALSAKDFARVTELAHGCVSCGLCALRCPVDISPFTIALQAVRIVGYVSRGDAPHLDARVAECRDGTFRDELEALCALGAEGIRRDAEAFRARAEAALSAPATPAAPPRRPRAASPRARGRRRPR